MKGIIVTVFLQSVSTSRNEIGKQCHDSHSHPQALMIYTRYWSIGIFTRTSREWGSQQSCGFNEKEPLRGEETCGESSAEPRLEPAPLGAWPNLVQWNWGLMGTGMEVAKSPGTCWGPRIMVKEVQKISPASSSSVSETNHSPLSCRTRRPHGSSSLGLGQGQVSARELPAGWS